MQHTPSPGHLAIIGLGPGHRDLLAPRAVQMLQACDTVIGYRVYIEQIRDLLAGKDVHVSELTHEVERATLAVQQARDGRRVCIVSSGDAGIYGMAGLVLDLLSVQQEEVAGDALSVERTQACPVSANLKAQGRDGATGDRKGRDGVNPSTTHLHGVHGKMCRRGAGPLATLAVVGSRVTTRALRFALMGASPIPTTGDALLTERMEASPIPTVEVVPGISALNAAAALLGAPLMHDFAVISLSDLLTPWATIAQRLSAAAAADFVIVLYNPISRKRHWQLGEARRLLLASQPATTPVGLVRNAYRPGQQVWLTTLEHLLDYEIDMFTTVVIGNSCTRIKQGRMITPRGYERYNAL